MTTLEIDLFRYGRRKGIVNYAIVDKHEEDVLALSSNLDTSVNHVGWRHFIWTFSINAAQTTLWIKHACKLQMHMKLWIRWNVHVDITWAPGAWKWYEQINCGEKEDELEREMLWEVVRWKILFDLHLIWPASCCLWWHLLSRLTWSCYRPAEVHLVSSLELDGWTALMIWWVIFVYYIVM